MVSRETHPGTISRKLFLFLNILKQSSFSFIQGNYKKERYEKFKTFTKVYLSPTLITKTLLI